MGKTRNTGNISADNNIFVDIENDRVGIGTTIPRFTLEVGSVGASGTSFYVNGDARIVGILTVGSSSITLDGSNNQVNVGTGITIHHTNGIQVGENTLHSTGITLNNVNVTGISTFSNGLNVSGGSGLSVSGIITATTFSGSLENTLTAGSYLTGTSYNNSSAVTFAVDATSANTASKVVARDESGNFSAGTITATLSGNASGLTGYSGTYWTSNNDGSGSGLDADLLDGIQASSFHQNGSGNAMTCSQAYVHDWIRTYGEEGLYSQSYAQHFYPDSGGFFWDCDGPLRIRDGYEGSIQGYVGYHDANGFGFLHSGGSWWLNTQNNDAHLVIGGSQAYNPYNSVTGRRLMFGGGNADALGSYYIGTNLENYGGNYNKLDLRWHTGIRMGARPNYGGIRFFDTEELGTQVFAIGKDGSYAQANQSMRAPIFYDLDNTNYYVDPSSYSQFNGVYANNWFRPQGSSGLYFESYGYGIWAPDSSGSSYGNVATYANGRNNWNGYAIGSQIVLMHDYNVSGNTTGLHDNSYGWVWRWIRDSYFSVDRGYSIFANSARAPIFYDSNDTNYYCDPNGTSRFNDVYIPGMPATSGGLGVRVVSGGQLAYFSSSIKVKENIEPIPYGSETIKKLNPITYTRKDEDNGNKYIGFIAEEMIEVIPEVVGLDKNGSPKGILYEEIVSVLTKSLQEVLERLDALENSI